MIEEAEIERAVNWLAKAAGEAAKARAEREYLSEFRKVLKAELMRNAGEVPVAVQEREAYADPKYLDFLQGWKAAIEEDERIRWLQTAAEAKISAWQTQQRIARV